MYVVYVIYNKKHGKIYIGQTEDIERRIKEHNDLNNKKHKYTSQFDGEWQIIYKEEFKTRKEALTREKQLKSFRGREYIKRFIPL